jgi:hypothetical protein
MEYSLNALGSWLPCERDFLLRTCPSMHTYSNIAIAMCNLFRQDSITSGMETWESLNRAAAMSIERCVRVCKFKLPKSVEVSFKCGRAFGAGCFDSRALHIPMLACTTAEGCCSSRVNGPEKRRMGGLPEKSKPQGEEEEEGDSSGGTSSSLVLLSELVCRQMGLDSSKPDSVLRSGRFLHDNFSLHLLPDVVWHSQQESLISMHGTCTARL